MGDIDGMLNIDVSIHISNLNIFFFILRVMFLLNL